MSQKTGRNHPCPCGSGKKYKHCCLGKFDNVVPFPADESPGAGLPSEFQTGTVLDDYSVMLQEVMRFADGLAERREEAELAARLVEDEAKYRPGEVDGLPMTLVVSAECCDFYFADTGATVCERLLEMPRGRRLRERQVRLLNDLMASYAAFYQIKRVTKKMLELEELWSGQRWRVHRINEPFESEAEPGAVWFVRLLGAPRESYIFTPPLIYPAAAKPDFTRALEQAAVLLPEMPREEAVRRLSKLLIWEWFDYFMAETAEPSPLAEALAEGRVRNTDGHELNFTTLTFRVGDMDGLRKKLDAGKRYDYDAENRMWSWFKPKRPRSALGDRTILATLTLTDGELVAETNSLERAQKLKKKLERECRSMISYKGMEEKPVSEFPPPDPADVEEQERLNNDPALRSYLRDRYERYYLEDWINHEIPILNGQTPREAVKTRAGRQRVMELLDYMTELEARSGAPDKFDFNILRKELGLPVKR